MFYEQQASCGHLNPMTSCSEADGVTTRSRSRDCGTPCVAKALPLYPSHTRGMWIYLRCRVASLLTKPDTYALIVGIVYCILCATPGPPHSYVFPNYFHRPYHVLACKQNTFWSDLCSFHIRFYSHGSTSKHSLLGKVEPSANFHQLYLPQPRPMEAANSFHIPR